MLTSIWEFLKEPSNQAVLTWLGGGIVVLAGGLWAVIKFRASKNESKAKREQTPTVSATGGSVAAGRDIKGPITTRGSTKR